MRNFLYILIIIAIIIGANAASDNSLRGYVLSLFEKPSIFLNGKLFELKILWLSLVNYSSIFEENTRLLEQSHKLLSENIKLESFKIENEGLKKQLSLSKKESYKLEPVRIFLFTYDINSAGAFIDKGSDFGIKEGQAVIYSGNVLLGFVREVFDSQSRIALITDPSISINVKTSQGVFALAKGVASKGVFLDFISSNDEIKGGDEVFTSGLDGVSENLLVGNVSKVKILKEGLFKNVFVEPTFQAIPPTNTFVIIP